MKKSAKTPKTADAAKAGRRLRTIADEYWQTQMKHWPLYATFAQYPQYHDRLNDNSPAGRKKEVRDLQRLLKLLSAVEPASLSESDRITWELMRWQISMTIERHDHKFYQWGGIFNSGVDHMDGIHSWIPSVVELAQPMRSAKDADALLKRIAAHPEYFHHHIEGIKEGLQEGRTAALVPVDRIIAQLKEMLSTPMDKSAYASAIGRLPVKLQKEYRGRILSALEEHVAPSRREYLEFLESYRERARPDDKPGICFVPGGKRAYRHLIRFHTSLDLSPEEIHRTGLDDLQSIHEEMRAIAGRMGHREGLPSFMDKLRQDSSLFFQTREEIVKHAENLVAETYKRLPDFFGRLPKTPLIVKPIEEYKEKNDVGARYFPPPEDLSRPGIYFINTYHPPTRPRFALAALTAHEGVPGHHLQIALAAENKALPAFQRFAEPTAFIEGWALYSERLADEMGLYGDDLSRFGMLAEQAFRACRLVVDTGLHALGWSRDKTIQFMKDNLPTAEGEIVAEVDRYMIWPGQALAYKLGQRAISGLRKDLEQKLGASFDIRAFHDAVLENGPLPLSILRQAVSRKLSA